MRRILLVEPSYRGRYPPLGLMKLATYHRLHGDYVSFVRGKEALARDQEWDRVYVSTLFTFWWKTTVDTIRYYSRSVASPADVVIGGVTASLMPQRLAEETGARVIEGLLDTPGILDPGDRLSVDGLMPDYSILDEVSYDYRPADAYFAYATRGCPNRCAFCAVPTIEPEFQPYVSLRRQVEAIRRSFGEKRDLILLDNNVLASPQFDRIVDEILELGFERGAILSRRKRIVDFNQGLDARRITHDNMRLLGLTALDPFRLALDHMDDAEAYTEAVETAREYYTGEIATYVLYNYYDTPADFYSRLRLNADLNQRFGTSIYSFPMRYVPLDATDRSYVGKHWNRRFLRGIQCILLVTHGLVGPKLDFFEAAFGSSPEGFEEIAMMPDPYIIHRRKHESNGAAEWLLAYRALTASERTELQHALSSGPPSRLSPVEAVSIRVKRLVGHFVEAYRGG